MPTSYPIRILTQLNPVLQGFRKSRGLTQADVAARLGVTQQSYARLEANPGRASMARILAVLQALEVDLTLTPRGLVIPAAASESGRGKGKANESVRPGAKTPAKTSTRTPAKAAVREAKSAPQRKPKSGQGQGEDW